MSNKYRKKPIVIDAIQFTGWNYVECEQFVKDYICDGKEAIFSLVVGSIPTLEGEMSVSVGDWIIRGIAGEIYPCKPAIFEATYDEVA